MKQNVLFLFVLFLLPMTFIYGQPFSTPGTTIGLLYSDHIASPPIDPSNPAPNSPSQVAGGYSLFSSGSTNKTYLIDMCGNVVNEWQFSTTNLDIQSSYLLEDGSVAKYVVGNGNQCLEVRDWNNQLSWTYCLPESEFGTESDLWYDFYPLSNGNFLLMLKKHYDHAELVALEFLSPPQNGLKGMSIIEVEPNGVNTGIIRWEWNLFDHLVQDLAPSLSNYGVIAQNPGRYDISLMLGTSTYQSTHFNGLHYNEDLKHIILSDWHEDEVFIIKHNSETDQSGQLIEDPSGPAGDFIFRWGNPQNYDKGDASDQKLFGQHDPDFIPNNYFMHGGKISIYNNKYNDNEQGAPVIIDPDWNTSTQKYETDANGSYLPQDFDYFWTGAVIDGATLFTHNRGGCQVLPNGNIFITESITGTLLEVTPNDDVVWVYRNPYWSGSVLQQGANGGDLIFKAQKYNLFHPGLNGKDLTPNGPLEDQNILTENCCPEITFDLPFSTSTNIPITLSASYPGGTFSGTGVIFSAFNPALAGPGFHTITYTYDDGMGCEESIEKTIFVFTISYNFVMYNLGVISPRVPGPPRLGSPNRGSGSIQYGINIAEPGMYNLALIDMNGKVLYSEQLEYAYEGTQEGSFKTNNLPPGMYVLSMSNSNFRATEKVIIH